MSQSQHPQHFIDNFIGQYSLSKTLRFELKPVGKTSDWLKIHQVFEKDKVIDKAYQQAKYYFDKLHQEFIRESLTNAQIDWVEYARLREVFKNADKNEKESLRNKLNRETDKKRKEIVELFDGTAKKWQKEYSGRKYLNKNGKEKKIKLRKKTPEALGESDIIGVLKLKFPKNKNNEYKNQGAPSLFVKDENGNDIYIFDIFEGFTTYLSKFQETRKNLYKDNGISTAVATRIVNENLPIFLDNIERYQKVKSLLDFSEIENKLDISLDDIFTPEYYNNLLLQEEIDNFNKNIVGELNKFINEARQKEQDKNKRKQMKFFNQLRKQILGAVEKEDQLIKEEDGQSNVAEVLRYFIKINEEKLPIIRKIAQYIFGGANQDGLSDDNLKGIYITKTGINTIAYRWFLPDSRYDFLFALPQKKSEDKDTLKIQDYISLFDIKAALEDNLAGYENIFKDKYSEIISNNSSWDNFLAIWRYEFNNLFIGFETEKKEKIVGYDEGLRELQKLLNKEGININRGDKEHTKIVKDYADAALRIFQMMKYFYVKDRSKVDILDDYFYSNEEFGFENKYFNDFELVRYYNALRNYFTQKVEGEKKIKINFDSGILLSGWDKSKEKEKLGIILMKEYKYYLGVINKEFNNIFDRDDIYVDNGGYKKMEYKLFPEASKMIPKISTQLKEVKEHFDNSSDDYILQNENFSKPLNISRRIFHLNNYGYYKDYLHQLNEIGERIDENKIVKIDSDNKGKVKIFQKEFFKLTREEETYKKALYDWIDFCKDVIGAYKSTSEFNYKLKDTLEYSSLDEFYHDLDNAGYSISFKNISEEYIDSLISEGKLYLFEIYNKDFSPYSRPDARKNIHTLYWQQIFSKENLEEIEYPLIRLSGQAEIFYRPESNIEKKPVLDKNGNHIMKDNKPVYHYQRFLKSKYLFHCSILLNAGRSSKKQFNKSVNINLKNHFNDIHILGIDRGEKHLLYYSLINTKGQIVRQGSWNEVNGRDYWQRLIELEKKRLEERQSWDPITKIKDLKNGYISAVIGEIVKMYKKYDMVVVLEDLNIGFKQSRGKFERNVYQQFERALIEKLNFLVFKDRNPLESGGTLRAYQLTAPFKTFRDIKKQTGVLFYTTPALTSIMDPVTGFINNIYPKPSETQERIKKNIIDKFIEFRWDGNKKAYYFEYNMKDFGDDYPDKVWRVYTAVPRVIRDRDEQNYWDERYIPAEKVTDAFTQLFELWGFSDLYGDIKKQIQEKDAKGELKGLKDFNPFDERKKKVSYNFYNSLAYLLRLVLQIRNSSSLRWKKDEEGHWYLEDEGYDFIASPVEPFFTSAIEKHDVKANLDSLIDLYIGEDGDGFVKHFNGDANGAYNIARKGLMMLERIKENPDRPDLYINKTDWVRWAVDRARCR